MALIGSRRLLVFNRRVAAVVFEAETDAIIARYSTPPSAQKQSDMNTLIKALKDAGCWAILDWLHIYGSCGGTTADMNLNWLSTSFTAVPSSSPTPSDAGYLTGTVAKRVDMGYNPSTSGGHLGQNSETIGAYSGTNSTSSGFDIQNANFAGGTRISLRNGGSDMKVQLNDSTSQQTMGTAGQVTSSLGAFSATRNGSAKRGIWGQTDLGGTTLASVAPDNTNLFLGGIATTETSRLFRADWGGGFMTLAQVQALHAAVTAYFTARGIP